MDSQKGTKDFLPVILGANRGSYSLARAFFEKYGIKTVIVSPFVTGTFNHSKIIHQYIQKKLVDSFYFLETITKIEKDFPNKKLLLFGSDDLYVELILQNQSSLSSAWVVPYMEQALYNQVNDKHLFYEICETAGVPYPKSIVLHVQETTFDLNFPVIIKPSQSSAYQKLNFEGKKKVYICKDQFEAQQIIRKIRKNGFLDELIVQEYIPGNDSHLGIVSIYVAKKDRELKMLSFGNVIVDDHSPTAIGNSLVVYVREELNIEKYIHKILQITDFYGFATFDVKFDETRQEYVFLELNARLGSSNYYVTAGGNNVAYYYVEDFLFENTLPFSSSKQELLYTILPKKLMLSVVHSKKLKKIIHQFYQTKQVYNPLTPCFEQNLIRKFYMWLSSIHYYKKLREHPPFE